MNRLLAFVRRRWFRILACAFFLLLGIAYLAFKYVLTETFVRSRIIPTAERGLRHSIEVDDVKGGFVSGFVARGVRIKEPADIGAGDHITAREVRVRPSWLDLLRGRVVFRSIECAGLEVLFRKTAEGKGSWMPDPRYPQLRGPERVTPVLIHSLAVSEIEYRFEDEGTGFQTVLAVREFAGTLRSDERAVVTVGGSWRTDSLVYGKPHGRRHVPGFASEGTIVSDTRKKRTDIRIRGFKGDEQVTADGVYNWEPGNSYVELALEEGILEFEGEFFTSLFPGFLPLSGAATYQGSVFRGDGKTRIRITGLSPSASIDRPGLAERRFRDVGHRLDFMEDPETARLVWSATGTLCSGSEAATCLLPFDTTLVYSPRQDRLAVRELRMSSPDAVLDASGFVWFPEAGRPALGLEGRGAVSLASGVARAFYAGIPLDASLSFQIKVEGSAEEPVLRINGGAPVLRLMPPWTDRPLEIPGFEVEESVAWIGAGTVEARGQVRGTTVLGAFSAAERSGVPPFRAEHRLLWRSPQQGWDVTDLEVTFPASALSLSYPASVTARPGPVRFQGGGDINEIARILSAEPPVTISATVAFEGEWERGRTPERITIRARAPRVAITGGEARRAVTAADVDCSATVTSRPGGEVTVSAALSAPDVNVALEEERTIPLGTCTAESTIMLKPGGPIDVRRVRADTSGWIIEATPTTGPPNRLWKVSARGELSRLADLFGQSALFSPRGDLWTIGYIAETPDGVSFEGRYACGSLIFGKTGSTLDMEFGDVTGEHWGRAGREEVLFHQRLQSASSVLRAATRHVPLGPASAELGIRWAGKEGRFEFNAARLENACMKIDLSGESRIGAQAPSGHYQLDIAGPLEVLWLAAAPETATSAEPPGIGDLRLRGELWREGARGRGSFQVSADELEIRSLAGGGSFVAQAGPETAWNWDMVVDIGKVAYRQHLSTDHHHRLRREGDRLWIDESGFSMGGGTVRTTTAVEFDRPEPRLSGLVWIEGSDLAAWVPSFIADGTSTIGGIASATAAWSAAGKDTAGLRRSLRASLRASLRDGYFRRTTVTRGISSLLGVDELQNVAVHEMTARARVEDERLTLRKAKLLTDRYRAEIEGWLEFDGAQEFQAILNLPIPIASQIPDLGGVEKIFPQEVPVAVRITGTTREPKMSVVRYTLIGRPLDAVGDLLKRFGRFFAPAEEPTTAPESPSAP